MLDSSWTSLLTVFDTLSAHALTERLNSEGVPTRLQTDSALLGAARACEIFVPTALLHRAQWLLSPEQFSDTELSDLATDELGSDRAKR
jgi:hypothetical protein